MVIDVLIRNYYERKGTFEGIQNTFLGSALGKAEESLGISWNDICYRCIGYPWVGEYTPSVVSEILRSFRDSTPDLLSQKYGLVEESSVYQYFSRIVRKETIKGLSKRSVKGYEDLAVLAGEYYCKDLSNMLIDKSGKMMPFRLWLLQNRKVKGCCDIDFVKPCLLRFSSSGGKEPVIYGRTVYAGREIDGSVAKKVNEWAVRYVWHRASGIFLHLQQKQLGELIMLSETDAWLYHRVIQYCDVNSVLYKDVARSVGVHVPDMFRAYRYSGTVFMALDDRFLVQCGTDDRWRLLYSDDFFGMVSDMGGSEDGFHEDMFCEKIKGLRELDAKNPKVSLGTEKHGQLKGSGMDEISCF